MLLRVHQWLYEKSHGWIGHRLLGVPCALLSTSGRKTKHLRVNALVYARDGDDYLLVASNGGNTRPPAWLFNLEANPNVTIQIGRTRRAGIARVLHRDGPDFDRRWQLVNANNAGRYDRYQQRTDRPIPIIAVRPSELA